MAKPCTVALVALVAAVVVAVAWSLWEPNVGGSESSPDIPAPVPEEAGPAPARGSDAVLPDGPVAPVPAAVGEAGDDPAAGALTDAGTPGPLPVAGTDFPPYLKVVAKGPRRDERGCKDVPLLLGEMAEETRDELWASRVETELRKLLERHPWGFQLAVGCRATICQVTEVGVVTDREIDNQAEWHRFWGVFMHGLRSAPVASEFATSRFFAGRFPNDLTPEPGEIPAGYLDIAGYVLTSVGQASPDEPTDCAPFEPLPDSPR